VNNSTVAAMSHGGLLEQSWLSIASYPPLVLRDPAVSMRYSAKPIMWDRKGGLLVFGCIRFKKRFVQLEGAFGGVAKYNVFGIRSFRGARTLCCDSHW
jgi:hypothetical protein